jgi:hypothetical protein
MNRELVSEEIHPLMQAQDTRRAIVGEPLLPQHFTWRAREFEIARVLETWKESSPCTSGAHEMYLRKHWYHICTTTGERMTIYFDRQPRRGRNPRARWWLYSIERCGMQDT